MEAGAYEGPSDIDITDPHLLELLRIRYVRAKLCMTALGRIHNSILSALVPKISFHAATPRHRLTTDPAWDQASVEMWIAHKGSKGEAQDLPGDLLQPGPTAWMTYEEVATPSFP